MLPNTKGLPKGKEALVHEAILDTAVSLLSGGVELDGKLIADIHVVGSRTEADANALRRPPDIILRNLGTYAALMAQGVLNLPASEEAGSTITA